MSVVSLMENMLVNPYGYTPLSTTIVILILAMFSYLGWFMLKDEEIDERFCIKALPFIAFGSVLRTMHDIGILSSFLFVTPFVWLLLFSIAGAIWLFSELSGTDFTNNLFVSGLVLFFFTFPKFIHPLFFGRLFLVLVMSEAGIILSRLLSKIGWMEGNEFYMSWQLFDAATTFVAISSGYHEEHVFSGALISFFGPIGIYIAKIPLMLLAFYLIEKYGEKEKGFLKFLVFLVAVGPGLRNLFSMLMNV